MSTIHVLDSVRQHHIQLPSLEWWAFSHIGEGRKWYSCSLAKTKEKAKLLYLHQSLCYYAAVCAYTAKDIWPIYSLFFMKTSTNSIRWFCIFTMLFLLIFFAEWAPSEKQQNIDAHRESFLEGSAMIDFWRPDHKNPLMLVLLKEIKGHPHKTMMN